MSILVVNTGSSSVKYALIQPSDPPTEAARVLARGSISGDGAGGARLRHEVDGQRHESGDVQVRPEAALIAVGDAFDRYGPDLVAGLDAVGHRVVHGGEVFTDPVVVDDAVIEEIERLAVLAPLHNPANAAGIRAAQRRFPHVPHVAVFDTAFHADLPVAARTYPVPRQWREQHGVRRYGFHGTSHAYVSRVAGHWLAEHRGVDPDAARVVVLHLGNGASACAVRGARSIDTSMGLTPLAGLVMGSRSGDIDPAVTAHLARVAGLSAADVEHALNHRSGLVGMTDDNDVRLIQQRADAGDEDARVALEMYAYRIRGYVGAYAVALGGLDALVFTAGVGENAVRVRSDVVDGLAVLGLALDAHRNAAVDVSDTVTEIGAGDGPAVLVVPTDEEGEIARQAVDLLAR